MANQRWEPPTTLYRLFDTDGRLLYVGISTMPKERIGVHRRIQPWGQEIASHTGQQFSTWLEAARAERDAYLAETPLHNKNVPCSFHDNPCFFRSSLKKGGR